MGFNCVIEFSPFFFPPASASFSSCQRAERKIFLLWLAARVKKHVFGSGRITGSFLMWVTMATPSKKVSACNVCVDCEYVCACVLFVCVCVFVPPVSLSALLCCHLQPDKPKDLSPSELPLRGG